MRLTSENKKDIFLALTKVHRYIITNKKFSWHKTFKECGIKSPNKATEVKNTLIRMGIIRTQYSGNKTIYFWNKEKTLPCMNLIEGIQIKANEYQALKKAKQTEAKVNINKKGKRNNNSYNFTPFLVYINNIQYPTSSISVTF